MTERSGEQWTIETLKTHVESRVENLQRAIDSMFEEKDLRYQQRFVAAELAVKDALVAQKEAVAAALAAADRGVTKAEVAAEKRFESVNEFRNTLKDQQAELMPRAEASVMFRAIDDKLGILTQRIDRTEGKGAGANAFWGYFVAVAMLAVLAFGAIASFLKH